jgi:hypothetical protein
VRFPQSVRLGSLRLKKEALRKPVVKKQVWQYAGDRILPGFFLNIK